MPDLLQIADEIHRVCRYDPVDFVIVEFVLMDMLLYPFALHNVADGNATLLRMKKARS